MHRSPSASLCLRMTCASSHSILMDNRRFTSDPISGWQMPAAAHVYQINAVPGKIDWDKNPKEESMDEIQSTSRATSAESHLGLICRYEVCAENTDKQVHLWACEEINNNIILGGGGVM